LGNQSPTVVGAPSQTREAHPSIIGLGLTLKPAGLRSKLAVAGCGWSPFRRKSL